MAFMVASCSVASPVAFVTSSEASSAFSGLKPTGLAFGKNATLKSKTVSNGSRVNCMKVWNPYGNKRYETLSYLPPLTPDQIAKQVDYLILKGWIPCLEFDKEGSVDKKNFKGSGYYDHRYWTMWKLPMFGCKDSAQVLSEIAECKKAYPQCYVRVLGFDAKRQVQLCGFLVQQPST